MTTATIKGVEATGSIETDTDAMGEEKTHAPSTRNQLMGAKAQSTAETAGHFNWINRVVFHAA